MRNIIARARSFAALAHTGQVRKYSGEPYIVHPVAVAHIVASVPHTSEMLAAALLHDVVEDTDTTVLDINKLFGRDVAMLVENLTDVSRPEHGNRKRRKALDRAHTAKACANAKTIKLADVIHNTSDIVANDPGYAVVYCKEKALLLEVLKEGDASLWERASKQIEEGIKHECS